MLTVLRGRDFRLLFTAQTLSVIGDCLIVVAVGLFVNQLTGDPSDVGLVLAAYLLPLVLFVLVGGVLADRLPRQKVMIVTDLVRGALHAVLALLIVTGTVRVWHMVVIGVLFSTAEAFFRPAYTGVVPQTVDEDGIQHAQALTGVSRELATLLSPALATALVLGVGGAAAFALDAATFFVSAYLLTRIAPRPRGEATEQTTVGRELVEGARAVAARPWVWVTIAAFSLALLTALTPFFVLGPSLAEHVYGDAAVYGWASALWGLGTASGAFAASRVRPRRPILTGMLLTLPWPVAIATYALGPPEPVLYVVMAVAGGGMGAFGVWWETALAVRIPPHLLSRVSAWDWMGSLALMPVGYLASGPLAAAVGDQEVLVGGAAAAFVACLLALLHPGVRGLGLQDDEGDLFAPPSPVVPVGAL